MELYIRSAGMMLRPRLFVLNCLVELLVGSEVVQVWLVPLIPSCLAEAFCEQCGYRHQDSLIDTSLSQLMTFPSGHAPVPKVISWSGMWIFSI